MIEWIASKSVARGGGWHIQVRTADQTSSFALVTGENPIIHRQTAAPGNACILTVHAEGGHTMNVYGKIRYEGDWD